MQLGILLSFEYLESGKPDDFLLLATSGPAGGHGIASGCDL